MEHIVLELKALRTYNGAHNIIKLVDILPNLSFTTSEVEHDYF